MSLQGILDKQTYDEYLRRLDARALLEHYGATNCSEQRNRTTGETEIVHSCLLDKVEPHHSNGDQNPSAACNIDSKKYICYSLGWGGDLFHFVNKMEGRESFSDTLTTVGKFLTGATLGTLDFRKAWERSIADNEISWFSLDLPSYDEATIASWMHPHLYWDYRGITAEAIATLKLGFDPKEKRVVFPHYVDGVLVGWQKRVIPGETFPDYPKYKNNPGFPKAETLYNFDVARKYDRVCVVESPMSVAKAVSLGVPNVVATFGAKVTEHQAKLLRSNFDRVYLWYDRDGAGLGGERKLAEKMIYHTEVLVVPPDYKRDLGDVESIEEMTYKLNSAVPAALRLGELRGHSGNQASKRTHSPQR